MNRQVVWPNLLLLVCMAFVAPAEPYARQRAAPVDPRPSYAPDSRLTGVDRLNTEMSDRLYSVVSSASSNLPYAEQQRFFIDLTERLTPPDQLAIRRRGSLIEIASSRAPRTTFNADGRDRIQRTSHGTSRERTSVTGDSLVLVSESSGGQSYRVT